MSPTWKPQVTWESFLQVNKQYQSTTSSHSLASLALMAKHIWEPKQANIMIHLSHSLADG